MASGSNGFKKTVENEPQERAIVSINNNNNDNHTIDVNKGKSIHRDDNQVALHVMMIRAVGIDTSSRHNVSFNRHYNVVYWVIPGEELRTSLTTGFEPFWNEKGLIFLDNLDDYVFLNLEVQRFNSMAEPGTSSRKVVVGRAKIPLPTKLNCKRKGEFSLIRIDGENIKAEGQIEVSMRLEMIKLDYNRGCR